MSLDYFWNAELNAAISTGVGLGLTLSFPAFKYKKNNNSYIGIYADARLKGEGKVSITDKIDKQICFNMEFKGGIVGNIYGESRFGLFGSKSYAEIDLYLLKDYSLKDIIEKTYSYCLEKPAWEQLPVIETKSVISITDTGAKSGGNISSDGGSAITERGVCWSKDQNPTISDSKTEDGTGVSSFTSNITGLEPKTTYHVRAYATNSKGTGYGNSLLFTTLEEVTDDVDAVDADGNVYSTVVIGNQEWFAENLKTTKYNDGTQIPNITSNSEWNNLMSDAYAWYDNDQATYGNAYGALYNWYAVSTGKLCPTGWHVPTHTDWIILANYAGGEGVAGSKLKSTRTVPNDHPRWESPNLGATDEYNFSALPGGHRTSNAFGNFRNVGLRGCWWSSSEVDATNSWFQFMEYSYRFMSPSRYPKRDGFSVRCLRD